MLAAPKPGAEEVLITVHEPARLSFTATFRTTFVTHQFYILITKLLLQSSTFLFTFASLSCFYMSTTDVGKMTNSYTTKVASS